MWPVETYIEQINEIPRDIINKKGSLTYFGSPCHLVLLSNRRQSLGIKNDKNNTIAIENDQYFVNFSKLITDNSPAKYDVVDYNNYIKIGAEIGVKFAIRNLPYNFSGAGKSKLWPDLVKADNIHGVLDFQSDILPISLQRGMDSSLIEMRNLYFDYYGLYKIKTLPFDIFSSWNADVATAIYFCKKEYSGNIEISTDISTYNYNFRNKGIIITPDTLPEVEFMFGCLENENKYKFKGQPHIKDKFYDARKRTILDPKKFSLTKTMTHKYPIVIRLTKEGYELGYTSEIFYECDHDRLVIPYQTSGYDNGNCEIGVVDFVPAGIQINGSYYFYNMEEKLGRATIKYLQSWPVKYLLYNWRTSATNDAPQLNIIPRLDDYNAKTIKDYLEMMGGLDIKKELLNGYKRKITKK